MKLDMKPETAKPEERRERRHGQRRPKRAKPYGHWKRGRTP